MITGVSYKCVPATGQEKTPFLAEEETWTFPNAESDTDHEPPGREVELKYININCR